MILGISGLAGSGKDTVAAFLHTDAKHINVALADPLKRMARDAFDFTTEQLWGPSQFRNAPDKRYPRHHTWEKAPLRKRGMFIDDTWHNCACCGQSAQRRCPVGDERDEQWRIDDSGCEPCFLTPRFALQKIGTEMGRTCYPNVWVEKTMTTAKELLKGDLDITYRREYGLLGFSPVRLKEPYQGVSIPDVRFKNEIEGIRAGGGKVIRVIRPGAGLTGAAGLHPSEAEQASIPNADFDWVIINDGTLDDLREKVAMMSGSIAV